MLAGLNAIVQLAHLDHHPAWSITLFVDGVIICALTVHSREFA